MDHSNANSFTSESYATTNSESSLPSSLYSNSSVDLLENAQYIFSLHEKSLQPLSNSKKNPRTSKEKEDEQHEIIVRELGKNVFGVPVEWARALYRSMARDDEIKEFAKSEISGLDIDRNLWASIPTDPTDASEVRESIIKVASTILGHFYPSSPDGVERKVVDSHRTQLVHDNGKHYSQPAVAIQAKGPSFEVPEHANGPNALGFTNVAAVIEIRLDDAKGSRRQQAEQLAVYCRQMFLQQPNRHFSRSLMVTEKQFRLVHYDRSGVYVTPFFDIHQDKEIFIRFVLGLSSLNEEDLGLDTSVQWTIDAASGKKVAGTITVGECGEERKVPQDVAYNLNMDEPPFVRPGIRGRGTTAWRATHPTTGEPLLIKDAWRTSARSAECEYLLAARGIPGVIQLVGYQDHCAETINYRPLDFKAPHFENRIKLRVVLKRYGACIAQFTSRVALICALRDAMIGHRKLLDKKVLHRDISLQNILFGSADAIEGERGVLIDLDLAVWAENGVSPVEADPRVGTRQYQSVAVCRSHVYDLPPPQTYLDDLESFFYVLVHIMFSFQKPRTVYKPQPIFLELWTGEDAKRSGDQKTGFALSVLPTRDIPGFWGKPCKALLKEFHSIIEGILRKKMEIRYDEDTTDDEKLASYHELSQQYDVYFQRVMSAFDTAIDLLKKEGLNVDEIAAIAKYPAPTIPSHSPPGPVGLPTPSDVPPSVNIAGPAAVPTPEKAPIDSLIKDTSSGTNKKRTSDDEPRDNTPRKRHRNEGGTTSPSPLDRSPRAKSHANPSSSRGFVGVATKRRHSPSPAS